MIKRKVFIGFIFSAMGITVPALFLVKIIEARVAFPVIFLLMGCQQLYNGFIMPKNNKSLRILTFVVGIFFTMFSLFVVIPWYYM
jgi:hypothetical protein